MQNIAAVHLHIFVLNHKSLLSPFMFVTAGLANISPIKVFVNFDSTAFHYFKIPLFSPFPEPTFRVL